MNLVQDIMTPKDKLVTVPQLATLREVLAKMKSNNVRSVIVDKSNPNGAYGLLTFKNLLQAIVAEDGDIELLSVYDLANTPAISVSSKSISTTVGPPLT
jgi:signal-transduction protein with cAMP-binding, CBS, and nucleotidyltransferase domain